MARPTQSSLSASRQRSTSADPPPPPSALASRVLMHCGRRGLRRDTGCTPIHTPVVSQILPTCFFDPAWTPNPTSNKTAAATSTTRSSLCTALFSLPMPTCPSDEVGPSPRWCCAELAAPPPCRPSPPFGYRYFVGPKAQTHQASNQHNCYCPSLGLKPYSPMPTRGVRPVRCTC